MKLDYYTLLCPVPIQLSIGAIQSPILKRIGEIGYSKFGMYQVYLKLTPEDYYTVIKKNRDSYWNYLSDEEKKDFTLYDIILLDKEFCDTFVEIFNFFFVERVIFKDNLFYIVDTSDYDTPDELIDLDSMEIRGSINPTTFFDVIDIIQQVCCIKSDDPLDEPMPKLKNAKAKKLYERMLKAKKEQEKKKADKDSINMTLPNMISATAAKCPGLNIVNIWDTTLFQLYDQFGKIQNIDIHYINSVNVAVWGDEKKQFDPSLWYKNNFNKDKNNNSLF